MGIALVGFVFKKSHKIHRENIEEEAESAREVLMPGAKGNGIGVSDYGAIGGSNGNGNGNMNGNGDVSPSGDEERRGRRI